MAEWMDKIPTAAGSHVRSLLWTDCGQGKPLPLLQWLVCIALACLAVPLAVYGQGAPSAFDTANPSQLPPDKLTTVDIQKALIWTGHYNGMVDGQAGPGMRAAITAWLRSRGSSAAERLSPSQLRDLIAQATQIRSEWQWTVYTDPSDRLQIGYPAKLFSPNMPDSQALVSFGTTDRGFGLSFFLPTSATRERFGQLYKAIDQLPPTTIIDYKAQGEDWFVLSAVQEPFAFFQRTQFLPPAELASFLFAMPSKDRDRLGFLTVAIANSFRVLTSPSTNFLAPPLATAMPNRFGSCDQVENLFSYGRSSFEAGNEPILGIPAASWTSELLATALQWGRQCIVSARQASGPKTNAAARMESTLNHFAKEATAGMEGRRASGNASRAFTQALEAEVTLSNGAIVSCQGLTTLGGQMLGLDDPLFGRPLRLYSDEDFRKMLAKLQDCERTLRPLESSDRYYNAPVPARITELQQFRAIKLGEEQREADAAIKQRQEIVALEEDKRLNPTRLPVCNDPQVLRLLTGLLSEKQQEKIELVDTQPRPRASNLMPDVYVPADGLYRRDGMEWRECLSFAAYEYMGAPRRLAILYRVTWKVRAKGEFLIIPE